MKSGKRKNSVNKHIRNRRGREGVALVIVLGFLAVLTVLAVSFAISMRVERLSSNTYYHGARTREFVHTGLARAIDEIDSKMLFFDHFYPQGALGPSGVPSYIYKSLSGVTDAPKPNPGLLASTEEALNYIPKPFPSDSEVEWVLIQKDPTDDDSAIIGRFAWIAIDCSGLLDANTISKETDRGRGINPGEIQIKPEPDATPDPYFAEISDKDVFITERDNLWRRFETVAELNQAPGIGSPVEKLFPYSLFPVGYYDADEDLTKQPINIGGTPGELLTAKDEIVQSFKEMGLSDDNAEMTWENLYDYASPTLIPTNTNSFGTKPVPMINEIVARTKFSYEDLGDQRTWTLTIIVETELWYPFVNSPATTGQFELKITPELHSEDDGGFEFSSADAKSQRTSISGDSWSWDVGTPQVNESDGVFVSLTHEFETTATVDGVEEGIPPTWVFPDPEMGDLKLSFLLHIPEEETSVVDRAQLGPLAWETFFAKPIEEEADTEYGSRWEVDDPRINWRKTDWKLQGSGRQTSVTNLQVNLEKMNDSVTWGEAGNDGSWHMYVRRSKLETVGVLGFLLYDASEPWQTIPLFDNDSPEIHALPVLDRFVVSSDRIRRGLVNINTYDIDVLTTVFLDMPIERWPNDPYGYPLTRERAKLIARAIINNGPQADPSYPSTFYTNLSDIARTAAPSEPGQENILDALPDTPPPPVPIPTPLLEKSIVRNSAGLLGVRQNLFTIIVAAQSVIDANNNGDIDDDEVMGERRAIAVVWRDPYPTDDGSGNLINRSFIRFFRWLDD